MRILERVIALKNAQQVLRAFRHNTTVRRKVTRTLLGQAIEFYIPDTQPARDELLAKVGVLPEDPTPMDADEGAGEDEGKDGADDATESKKPKQDAPRKSALPEIELYLRWLVTTTLIRHELYDEAVSCATVALGNSAALNRRTADPFHAKLWMALSLCFESTGRLQEIRSQLLSAYRTACLQHNEVGQATLLALLLRNYTAYALYDQALKLVSKTNFPEGVSNNQFLRYTYYIGKIQAIQLDYTDANAKLQQVLRKVPSSPPGGSAGIDGFRRAVAKLAIVVQLLMGTIPERETFDEPALKASLAPYLQITQSLRVGNLREFSAVMERHGDTFRKDSTFTLVSRLRHNVIKTGLRKISVSYSRISFADIGTKLHLDASDVEPICAKAIRDGVIDAVLDHDGACMLSKQGHNVYTTTEPMYAFHKRTMFCMDVHP